MNRAADPAAPQHWLAFDTTTERMSVALAAGEREWRHEAAGGAQASLALIPAIQGLLGQAGLVFRDLELIAYGRGPGTFTGLRGACAVAQGLAYGLGLQVVPVDSLMAVAEDARQRAAVDEVWAAMDARMGEIYAAHYRHTPAGWQVIVPPALYTASALAARWQAQPPRAVAGSALGATGVPAGRLLLGAAVQVPDAWPGAASLLPLARAGWAAGAAVAADAALPLYLRDKVALTTAERDAERAARQPERA